MNTWLNWIDENRLLSGLIGVICILLILVIFMLFRPNPDSGMTVGDFESEFSVTESSAIEAEDLEESNEVTSEEVSTEVIVDIKGAVNNPGVYSLLNNQRVIDAVDMAGGFTKAADSSSINLAALLVDEQLIYVYEQGEEIREFEEKQTEEVDSKDTDQILININTASQEEFTQLNGIGESKAGSIVAYREENGQFESIEAIKEVSGIGEKTFENLRDFITID